MPGLREVDVWVSPDNDTRLVIELALRAVPNTDVPTGRWNHRLISASIFPQQQRSAFSQRGSGWRSER